MKTLVKKNPEMEKWGGKIMIRVQFMCFIFIFFPKLSLNPWGRGGGYSAKYIPLQLVSN